MKITLPLYQTAVAGIFYGVGTFRQTAHGAILTRTPGAPTRTAPGTDLGRRRFQEQARRAVFSAETAQDFIARTLPGLALSGQPRPLHAFQLSSALPAFNLRDLLPQRATFRSFLP